MSMLLSTPSTTMEQYEDDNNDSNNNHNDHDNTNVAENEDSVTKSRDDEEDVFLDPDETEEVERSSSSNTGVDDVDTSREELLNEKATCSHDNSNNDGLVQESITTQENQDENKDADEHRDFDRDEQLSTTKQEDEGESTSSSSLLRADEVTAAVEEEVPGGTKSLNTAFHSSSSCSNTNFSDTTTSSTTSDATTARIPQHVKTTIRTIHTMNKTNGLCVHPSHYHSFKQTSSSSATSAISASGFYVLLTREKCYGCKNRLRTLFHTRTGPGENSNIKKKKRKEAGSGIGGGNNNDDGCGYSSNDAIVKCLTCGVYAHRSCAFHDCNVYDKDETTSSNNSKNRMRNGTLEGHNISPSSSSSSGLWNETNKCTVNENRIREAVSEIILQCAGNDGSTKNNEITTKTRASRIMNGLLEETLDSEKTNNYVTSKGDDGDDAIIGVRNNVNDKHKDEGHEKSEKGKASFGTTVGTTATFTTTPTNDESSDDAVSLSSHDKRLGGIDEESTTVTAECASLLSIRPPSSKSTRTCHPSKPSKEVAAIEIEVAKKQDSVDDNKLELPSVPKSGKVGVIPLNTSRQKPRNTIAIDKEGEDEEEEGPRDSTSNATVEESQEVPSLSPQSTKATNNNPSESSPKSSSFLSIFTSVINFGGTTNGDSGTSSAIPESKGEKTDGTKKSNDNERKVNKKKFFIDTKNGDETDMCITSPPGSLLHIPPLHTSLDNGVDASSLTTQSDVDGVNYQEEENYIPIWTRDGPPSHWALNHPQTLKGLAKVGSTSSGSPISTPKTSSSYPVRGPPSSMFSGGHDPGTGSTATATDESTDMTEDDASSLGDSPLNYMLHPFHNVSKALQENIVAHFVREKSVIPSSPPPPPPLSSDSSDGDGGDNEVLIFIEEDDNNAEEDHGGNEEVQDMEKHNDVERANDDGSHMKNETLGVVEDNDANTKDHPEDEQIGLPSLVAGTTNECKSENDTQSENSAISAGSEPVTPWNASNGNTSQPRDSATTKPAVPISQSATPQIDATALLKEVEPKPPPSDRASLAKAALRSSINLASVAGGIAGGVAGLVIAGPAGAVIGAKLAQTAGALGVIIEGSVSVGVFVAGVAAAGYTANQLKNGADRRVLTFGEDGVKRKVMLVRPNVVVDPIWEEIATEARKTYIANTKRRGLSFIANHKAKVAEMARRERYMRDSDVVETDEREIKTEEKVLLLVSRSLNDKLSLPGHVYRHLIQEYKDRCERRISSEGSSILSRAGKLVSSSSKSVVSRERRQDTHGVIKHVTASLLEIRPGFGSSPAVTEMSATAVERLVFGELYDSVFEEILEETREMDTALMEKILLFERGMSTLDCKNTILEGCRDGVVQSWRDVLSDLVSNEALDALLMLPKAHSAVDKLSYCVTFLELISVQFSSPSGIRDGDGGGDMDSSAMGADSLLKMVCQHIIVAKVPNLNAEIAFLEEFARDEQLLRGKEGYALVTLQASLHFLNGSSDLGRDIFGDDD